MMLRNVCYDNTALSVLQRVIENVNAAHDPPGLQFQLEKYVTFFYDLDGSNLKILQMYAHLELLND